MKKGCVKIKNSYGKYTFLINCKIQLFTDINKIIRKSRQQYEININWWFGHPCDSTAIIYLLLRIQALISGFRQFLMP
jgi:hypothetical protein